MVVILIGKPRYSQAILEMVNTRVHVTLSPMDSSIQTQCSAELMVAVFVDRVYGGLNGGLRNERNSSIFAGNVQHGRPYVSCELQVTACNIQGRIPLGAVFRGFILGYRLGLGLGLEFNFHCKTFIFSRIVKDGYNRIL